MILWYYTLDEATGQRLEVWIDEEKLNEILNGGQ
jgi:hypothetical protein